MLLFSHRGAHRAPTTNEKMNPRINSWLALVPRVAAACFKEFILAGVLMYIVYRGKQKESLTGSARAHATHTDTDTESHQHQQRHHFGAAVAVTLVLPPDTNTDGQNSGERMCLPSVRITLVDTPGVLAALMTQPVDSVLLHRYADSDLQSSILMCHNADGGTTGNIAAQRREPLNNMRPQTTCVEKT